MEHETHIQIRISKADKKLFKAAAETDRLSLSEWMRQTLTYEAIRILYVPKAK